MHAPTASRQTRTSPKEQAHQRSTNLVQGAHRHLLRGNGSDTRRSDTRHPTAQGYGEPVSQHPSALSKPCSCPQRRHPPEDMMDSAHDTYSKAISLLMFATASALSSLLALSVSEYSLQRVTVKMLMSQMSCSTQHQEQACTVKLHVLNFRQVDNISRVGLC